MNMRDIMEDIWGNLGMPDTASLNRTDATRQKIRDKVNEAQGALAATCAPSLNFLKRETTITLVAGTQDYLINDWCQRPLSMWLEGSNAHPIFFRKALLADWDGSRNSSYYVGELGPWQVTLLPRTTTPLLGNIAGANTGITGAEDALTATVATSGNAVFTDAVVGRMLTFNGEDNDYRIESQSSRTLTLDKPIKARLRGDGTTGLGAGYAAATARWEIGPPGRFKLRFLPTPTAAATVYVRYMAYPRFLIGDSDTPELQRDMHSLLVKGAMKGMATTKQNTELFGLWQAEFERQLKDLRRSDMDDISSGDVARPETLETGLTMEVPRDLYSRSRSRL